MTAPAPPAPPTPSPRERPLALRLALATALVAAACAMGVALRPWIAPTLYMPFFAAVAVAAWYGGLHAGLYATLLSAAAANYVLTAPYYAFGLDMAEGVRAVGFLLTGWLISALSAGMRDARARAERGEHEARLLAAQLEEHAVELELHVEQAQAMAAETEQQIEETQVIAVELEERVAESDALRGELERVNARLAAARGRAETEGRRLARILDTMAEGVCLLDAEGRITYANAAGARILAVPLDGLVGVRYDAVPLHPPRGAAAPGIRDRLAERVLRRGDSVQGEELTGEVGGRVVTLRLNAVPLRDDDGAIAGAVASFDDVTARRAAEEAVRESEARFRTLADTAPVLVWMSDETGAWTFFNLPWLEFRGRTAEEELGDGWLEGVHPDDARRCLAIYATSFDARRPFRMEYRLRRHDGEWRWVMNTGVPRQTPDGGFAGYVGSCVDITDRRVGEERQRFLADAGTLLASSLDYETTLRSVAQLAVPLLADYCVVDLRDGDRVRRVEAAHADPALQPLVSRLLEHPPELESRNLVAEVLRSGVPQLGNEVTAAQRSAWARDPRHLALLESLAPTAYMAVPLVARGRVIGSLLFCMTGSGRRYDEDELALAEDLARRAAFAIDNARLYEDAVEADQAKADFLAVMSHELRTPLNAIIGYTDLFLMGIPVALPGEVQPQLGRVRAAARHLLELIDEILTFARLEAGQEEVHREAVEAADLVHDAASLVEPLAMERGLDFRVEGADGVGTLRTDVRKVRQILVNLLGNAVKFTERGAVSIRAVRDGGDALFQVDDTGIGIAGEQLPRIFEPFQQVEQTTIRTRGGSGLGLTVARQLARLLGGDVTCTSRVGEGSRFLLRLPLAEDAPAAAPSPPPERDAARA
jgi:PAS domain S-box-containing protein